VVVHIFDQRVFDGDAAAGFNKVVIGGVQGFIGVPAGVHGDHLIAQFVIRCVQRKCEGYGDTFGRKFIDGRHEPNGGHRDLSSRDTQTPRSVVDHTVDRVQDPAIVRQGFTHSHEDDVGYALDVASAFGLTKLPVGNNAISCNDLVDNFGGR